MLVSAITILLSVYILLSLLLYIFQENFLYFPDSSLVSNPSALQLDYDELYLNSSDGNKIHAWYIEHKNPRAHVLFFHGNAGNISHRLDSIKFFHDLGLSTLIIDYQGYGLSEGKASEKGSYDDALAAWDYLTKTKNINPENIIIFGRSLGGGVASWLASEKPSGLVIMESTFSSVAEMGKDIYPYLPVRLLTRIHYNNKERIRHIKTPVLIVHSKTDELIPYKHGRMLYELANEPRRFLEIQGGHNDGFFLSRDFYKENLDNFIKEYLK